MTTLGLSGNTVSARNRSQSERSLTAPTLLPRQPGALAPSARLRESARWEGCQLWRQGTTLCAQDPQQRATEATAGRRLCSELVQGEQHIVAECPQRSSLQSTSQLVGVMGPKLLQHTWEDTLKRLRLNTTTKEKEVRAQGSQLRPR